MMSFALPTENQSFIFLLHDKEFTANIFKFGCYSRLFQNNIDLIIPGKYVVKSKVKEESFRNFLDACQGKFLIISENNIIDISKLCSEFQTIEIENETKHYMKDHRHNKIITQLKEKYSENLDISQEIQEISKNLSVIIEDQIDELDELDDDIIYQILSQKDRDFKRESDLFQFVKERTEKTGKCSKIFNKIDITKLTIKELIEFSECEYLPEFYESKKVFPLLTVMARQIEEQNKNIEKLNDKVKKMSSKIDTQIKETKKSIEYVLSQQSQDKNLLEGYEASISKFISQTEEFQKEFSKINNKITGLDDKLYPLQLNVQQNLEKTLQTRAQLHPFDGIFKYLTGIANGNPSKTGKVKINTGLNRINCDYDPSDLLEYEDPGLNLCYYHDLKKTQPNKDNFIEFDFGNNSSVSILGYTIRTNIFGETFAHPKHFSIKGSNDHNNWTLIDEVKNASELNGSGLTYTYFPDHVSKPFRYIRFTQYDSHFPYEDRFGVLAISAFELFGAYHQE
ncbi:hypothetical protein TRFO_42435 [Tritrichomonas foetus]|uniref:F5/8 type C domain-containing protein n=1 Tax=Tritrichomonas foetus TaxID=1144522 RepID=A0A1J4KWJ6_9EUKA|nr:hypothetical protein TRFO_42435 [Tritrichomonas foetus]|eukprot:OHT15607.1 hypothetical protein TRFO_42435 [Tritrichomonas foetus]